MLAKQKLIFYQQFVESVKMGKVTTPTGIVLMIVDQTINESLYTPTHQFLYVVNDHFKISPWREGFLSDPEEGINK